MSSPFKLGDIVTWTSQAAGIARTKTGQIVEVVPPGERPNRERFVSLYKNSGVGSPRPAVSYVVMVGRKAYWPLANKLATQVAEGGA